jgi:TonB family protein
MKARRRVLLMRCRLLMKMKIKLIITLLALYVLLSHKIVGQASESNKTSSGPVIDVKPYPKDGMEAFLKHFEQHLQYPESALKDRLSGQVIISFVVDTTGKLIDYKITKGVREDIDQEALRLMSFAPDWVPGYHNGRVVKARMSFPLNFFATKKARREYFKAKGINDKK